jgi:hypothetical protein
MIDILPRLDRVKPTGQDKWLSRCPAHDDKNPSLSVAWRNGAWLIHCFSGCDTAAVLAAIGLEYADIMPERDRNSTPIKKNVPFTSSDALRALSHEALILEIAAKQIVSGTPLSQADAQRIAQAAQRIAAAGVYTGVANHG